MSDEHDAHPGEMPLAILFDIDGTLITTGGAGARSWAWSFRTRFERDVDILKFSELGMTDPEVARRSFHGVFGRDADERELSRLVNGYLERLPEEVGASTGYRVMPGVNELLSRLVDDSVLLGLTTGNLEAAAHIKLSRGGLNRFFSFGGYGSDSNDRAELTRRAIERAGVMHGHALDPARVVVVGDTPRDVDAAHAAGAVALAVATGSYTVDQLREAGADHVVPTLAEPLRVI